MVQIFHAAGHTIFRLLALVCTYSFSVQVSAWGHVKSFDVSSVVVEKTEDSDAGSMPMHDISSIVGTLKFPSRSRPSHPYSRPKLGYIPWKCAVADKFMELGHHAPSTFYPNRQALFEESDLFGADSRVPPQHKQAKYISEWVLRRLIELQHPGNCNNAMVAINAEWGVGTTVLSWVHILGHAFARGMQMVPHAGVKYRMKSKLGGTMADYFQPWSSCTYNYSKIDGASCYIQWTNSVSRDNPFDLRSSLCERNGGCHFFAGKCQLIPALEMQQHIRSVDINPFSLGCNQETFQTRDYTSNFCPSPANHVQVKPGRFDEILSSEMLATMNGILSEGGYGKLPKRFINLWSGGVFMAYLTSPGARIKEKVLRVKQELKFTAASAWPTLALHVRTGDTCNKRFKDRNMCHDLHGAMPVVRRMIAKYGFKAVFLATTGKAVIEQTKSHPEVNFMYQKDVVRFDYHQANSGTEDYGAEERVETWLNTGKLDGERDMVDFMVDTEIMSDCHGFVGDLASAVASATYLLMISKHGPCPKPYASVVGEQNSFMFMRSLLGLGL